MLSMIRTIARILFGHVLPRIAYPVVRGPLKHAWFVLGALEGKGGGATVYFKAATTARGFSVRSWRPKRIREFSR